MKENEENEEGKEKELRNCNYTNCKCISALFIAMYDIYPYYIHVCVCVCFRCKRQQANWQEEAATFDDVRRARRGKEGECEWAVGFPAKSFIIFYLVCKAFYGVHNKNNKNN